MIYEINRSLRWLFSQLFHVMDIVIVVKRLKLKSISFVKLVLKLNPMQPQRVKKTLHCIHTHENTKSDPHQSIKHNRHLNYTRFTATIPMKGEDVKPISKVLLKNTFASWECASDRAHKRRYDAVFEIAPNTNSIVSISWWTKISLGSWSWSLCPYD